MSKESKQLKLSLLLVSPPHHKIGWRYPGADAGELLGFEHYRRIARKAEEGKLDMLFLADKYMAEDVEDPDFWKTAGAWPEPLTLLSSLVGETSRIGLCATASTTYGEPFHIARMIASLDHLSGGRASWNVVTSNGNLEARNFGHARIPAPELRHEQSEEFVRVVKALWDSWDDDAVIADRDSGRYLRPGSARPIDHEGKWFQVKGPLNVLRPVQGHPVIVHAGASEALKARAAQDADVVFTALKSLPIGQAFYRDIKSRAVACGRSPDELLVLPGLNLTVGRTEDEVLEKQRCWTRYADQKVKMDHVSAYLGIDVDSYSLDDPLPDVDTAPGVTPKYRKWHGEAVERGLRTIGELYRHIAQSFGHLSLSGTPAQIADQMERWLKEGGADGFTFIPRHFPGELDDLVDLVIPELQNRGLFRKEYEGRTLREHLGLARP